MQNTSNYNLNIVEGTDIVNIPVQLNPNFQTIDSEMFKNKQGSTGTATEVVTGTVHAIVRANTDADVFRFTATGNWASGDTMTVDGGAVTVHLTDGTAPGAGAYVIGAEVVAVINGTLVTLISSSAAVDPGVTSFNSRTGAVIPASSDYDASMIDYDNTLSGLLATDVQGAIDEVKSSIPDLSNTTTLYSVGDNTCEYKVIDNMVMLYATVAANSGEVTFGTLPNELKPSVRVDNVFYVSGTTPPTNSLLFISTSGTVKAINVKNEPMSTSAFWFI